MGTSPMYTVIGSHDLTDFEARLNDADQSGYELVNSEMGEYFYIDINANYYRAIMKRKAPNDIKCPNCELKFSPPGV